MRKYIVTFILLTLATFLLTGCTNRDSNGRSEEFIFQKISPEEANEMITSSSELIILDVRTQEEYDEGHISGAILIPNDEIELKAEEILTDKNATILVYCRSGRRSALASQTLSELGYLSIYDFGGILDWPYEIVTN
ncbi:MAG: Phage shock protein precursor [Herbinix sp.]|jgi:rhodanese-related sulfurtransferase|nr:Phage shock protein precursor [Herbinix sp.]